MEQVWWRVKVFDPESKTCTYLDKLAESVEDIEKELKEDGLWVFVSATISIHQ